MAIGTIVQWNAPGRACLGSVEDAGMVVTVRIWPRTGEPAINPSALGVIPHVVFVPDLPSVGTTGFQTLDMYSMLAGERVGDYPRAVVSRSSNTHMPEYWINLGVPFLCPWAGQIHIEGGLVAGGAESATDAEVVISRPELKGKAYDVVNPIGMALVKEDTLVPGRRPKLPPTITFLDVPTTGTPIPTGVVAVQVPVDTDVVFTALGMAARTIRVNSGQPFPLPFGGFGGTFQASAGTIATITFILEIA